MAALKRVGSIMSDQVIAGASVLSVLLSSVLPVAVGLAAVVAFWRRCAMTFEVKHQALGETGVTDIIATFAYPVRGRRRKHEVAFYFVWKRPS